MAEYISNERSYFEWRKKSMWSQSYAKDLFMQNILCTNCCSRRRTYPIFFVQRNKYYCCRGGVWCVCRNGTWRLKCVSVEWFVNANATCIIVAAVSSTWVFCAVRVFKNQQPHKNGRCFSQCHMNRNYQYQRQFAAAALENKTKVQKKRSIITRQWHPTTSTFSALNPSHRCLFPIALCRLPLHMPQNAAVR